MAHYTPKSLEEAIDRLGSVTWLTEGTSMRPLIKSGRDYVTIRKPVDELRPFDVALYRRIKDGERQYVLHRIIGVEMYFYRIRGDNCIGVERIPKENVIGVMTGLIRNGKEINLNGWRYRTYVQVWHKLYPLRKAYLTLRHRFARLLRRMPISRFNKPSSER